MSKKPDWFKGIFPALVTPFTKENKVDEAALKDLIKYLLPHIDGVVACGTTGEFVYLSDEEKRRIFEITVEEIDGRLPVIVGTACPSTRETVKLTSYAKKVGATAALVAAPYYIKPSFNEVYEHYEALSGIGISIILYNIPQCTGTHFKWWTAEGILKLENVVGIKDSSADVPFLEALLEKVRGEVGIFCGHDEIVVAALAAGADGAILASANLIPDIWQKIYQSIEGGDLAAAQNLQAKIQKLIRIIARSGSTQAVKEGLQMMGLKMSNSRLPIIKGGAFPREDGDELRNQLENLDKIAARNVEFDLGNGKKINSKFPAVPKTPEKIKNFTLKTGEAFSGPPLSEVAHIDLLMGVKNGPVDRAIKEALGQPRSDSSARIIKEEPKIMLVPTVTIRTSKQASHIYKEATEGIVAATEDSVKSGVLPREVLNDIVMIANVFVHPAAVNRQRIRMNNYKAMRAAIRKALENQPTLEEILTEKESARHPFRYAP